MKEQEAVEGEVISKPKAPHKKLLKGKVGFGAFSAVVVTVFSYIASQFFAAIFIGFWAGATGRDVESVFNNIETSTGLQFAFFLLVEAITLYILWWFLKSRNNSFKDIGMSRKPSIKDISPALVTFAIYFVLLIVITAAISALVPGIDTEQEQELGFKGVSGLWPLTMVFISLVILPPIVEEIVVRGFLYTGLRKKYAIRIAAVLASALFAVAHLQLGSGNPPLWIAAIDTFVLSMFLINLRERTGALWSGMIVHGLKNGLAFLLLFVFKVSGI